MKVLNAILTSLWLLAAAGAGASPLNLVVVEGEGAINNARQRTAREIIVQVEDENRKPVAGAVVVFLLPNQGPGGQFSDGSRMLTVVTGVSGRAVARGMKLNSQAGTMAVRVTASYLGQRATRTIEQANAGSAAATAAGLSLTSKILIAAGIIAGAATTGAVLATRNGSSPGSNPGATTTTPTTISFGGAGSVGAP